MVLEAQSEHKSVLERLFAFMRKKNESSLSSNTPEILVSSLFRQLEGRFKKFGEIKAVDTSGWEFVENNPPKIGYETGIWINGDEGSDAKFILENAQLKSVELNGRSLPENLVSAGVGRLHLDKGMMITSLDKNFVHDCVDSHDTNKFTDDLDIAIVQKVGAEGKIDGVEEIRVSSPGWSRASNEGTTTDSGTLVYEKVDGMWKVSGVKFLNEGEREGKWQMREGASWNASIFLDNDDNAWEVIIEEMQDGRLGLQFAVNLNMQDNQPVARGLISLPNVNTNQVFEKIDSFVG